MEPTIIKQNMAYRGAPESRKFIELSMQLLHDIKALAWMMDGDDGARVGHSQALQANMKTLLNGTDDATETLNSETVEYQSFQPYDTVRLSLNSVEARLQHLRRLTV